MDLYADQILQHYKNPRHAVPIVEPDATHEEANISCGDTVQLQVKIEDGVLRNIGWHGAGCAISQAGMSLLSDHVLGKTVDEVLAMRKQNVLELLGVPVSERRMKCALLSLHTLQNTLRLHQALPLQSWAETVAPAPGA